MNVGFADRLARLMGGLGLLAVDFLASSEWELFLLGFGIWGVLTSTFGWCPFYKLTGVNTCPIDVDAKI